MPRAGLMRSESRLMSLLLTIGGSPRSRTRIHAGIQLLHPAAGRDRGVHGGAAFEGVRTLLRKSRHPGFAASRAALGELGDRRAICWLPSTVPTTSNPSTSTPSDP